MVEYNDLLKKQSGFWDYNDLATLTTPITIPGTGAWTPLTNDGEGANSNSANKPTDIVNVYDVLTDLFDFSELAIGDRLEIRLDLLLTTTSVNTEIEVQLDVGQGSASNFTQSYISPSNFKSTVIDSPLNRYNFVYIGGQDIIDNPAQFQMRADSECTVKVVGWACSFETRSVS